MTSDEPLVICTAWNSAFAKHGEICSESIQQHIRRVEENGGAGLRFVSRLIPDDYPRPPSWWKIGFIKELLQHAAPHVLWIDCDALLIDQGDIREGLDGYPPLHIAADINGVNGGVMLWNAQPSAFQKLDEIEVSSEQFLTHKWWETAALHSMMANTTKGDEWWSLAPKQVFNAYTSEICPETRIVHYPGFSPEDKLKLMEAQIIAIRRNGHGTNLSSKLTEKEIVE